MATRLSPLEGLRKNREKGERRDEEMVKKSWAEGEMGKLKLVKREGKWDVNVLFQQQTSSASIQ